MYQQATAAIFESPHERADSELEAAWHWKHCYEALVLMVNATAKKKDLANKLKVIKQPEHGILVGVRKAGEDVNAKAKRVKHENDRMSREAEKLQRQIQQMEKVNQDRSQGIEFDIVGCHFSNEGQRFEAARRSSDEDIGRHIREIEREHIDKETLGSMMEQIDEQLSDDEAKRQIQAVGQRVLKHHLEWRERWNSQ